jgi:hypothetical protein
MPRRLTPEQIDYIVEHYPIQYTKDVAKHLGLAETTIYNLAFRLNLKKDETFRAMELQRQADRLRQVGKRSRFNKGTKPPNYGKKMTPELYEKCKGTMFKKGARPVNWKPDGSERTDVDGYTMIKVNGKYIQKHVHIWNQHHGEVPKGSAVIFKDGNRQNLIIENLILVTRKELMLKNTIQRYDPELQFTMKVLSKLKKKIDAKK